MFYNSRSTLVSALNLMVNHTDRLQLMSNIYDTLMSVNESDVIDAYNKKIFRGCKDMAKALLEKGLRTVEQAKMYFDNSNMDEDVKSLVKENNYFSEEVLHDYTKLFAKLKYMSDLKKNYEKVENAWTDFQLSGVSDIDNQLTTFLDANAKLDSTVTNLRNDTSIKSTVLITHHKDINNMGVRKLEEDFNVGVRRMKTGMWVDHLTGGGFKAGMSYIVASISGGFKSGFLQNMAEFMSIANKINDFRLPAGLYPCILYVNLEMSQTQMTERRASFYGIDKNYLSENKDKVEDIIEKKLEEFGSDVPVLYQKEDGRVYSCQQLLADIKNMEKNGLRIVALVVDYSDLLKVVMSSTDEIEGIKPLVRKNEELRAIAQKYNIPVLTGIQLNRSSSELKKRIHRAHKEDILKYLTSETIAKAFDVINVPEQLFFCFKFPTPNGDDFFSIIVDKDRENDSKFIDKNGKEIKSKINRVHYVAKLDGFRITNDYEDTITKYDTGDDSIITTMELTEEELDEV